MAVRVLHEREGGLRVRRQQGARHDRRELVQRRDLRLTHQLHLRVGRLQPDRRRVGAVFVGEGSPACLASTSEVTSPSWVSTIADWNVRPGLDPVAAQLNHDGEQQEQAGHAGGRSAPRTGPSGAYPDRTRRARAEPIARRIAPKGDSGRPCSPSENPLSEMIDDQRRSSRTNLTIIDSVSRAASTDGRQSRILRRRDGSSGGRRRVRGRIAATLSPRSLERAHSSPSGARGPASASATTTTTSASGWIAGEPASIRESTSMRPAGRRIRPRARRAGRESGGCRTGSPGRGRLEVAGLSFDQGASARCPARPGSGAGRSGPRSSWRMSSIASASRSLWTEVLMEKGRAARRHSKWLRTP